MIAQGSLVLHKQKRTVFIYRQITWAWQTQASNATAIASATNNDGSIFTVLQCMLVDLSLLYSPHQLRVIWFEKLATAVI